MKDPLAMIRHEKKYCYENPRHEKFVKKWAKIVEKIFFFRIFKQFEQILSKLEIELCSIIS